MNKETAEVYILRHSECPKKFSVAKTNLEIIFFTKSDCPCVKKIRNFLSRKEANIISNLQCQEQLTFVKNIISSSSSARDIYVEEAVLTYRAFCLSAAFGTAAGTITIAAIEARRMLDRRQEDAPEQNFMNNRALGQINLPSFEAEPGMTRVRFAAGNQEVFSIAEMAVATQDANSGAAAQAYEQMRAENQSSLNQFLQSHENSH